MKSIKKDLDKVQKSPNFCPYCGFKLNIEVKFCPECGTQLQSQGMKQSISEEQTQAATNNSSNPETQNSKHLTLKKVLSMIFYVAIAVQLIGLISIIFYSNSDYHKDLFKGVENWLDKGDLNVLHPVEFLDAYDNATWLTGLLPTFSFWFTLLFYSIHVFYFKNGGSMQTIRFIYNLAVSAYLCLQFTGSFFQSTESLHWILNEKSIEFSILLAISLYLNFSFIKLHYFKSTSNS